jgi:hypothetical protein
MSVTVTGLSPRSLRQNVQATSPDPSSKTTSPTTADTSASQDTDVNTDHTILMAGLVTAGSTVGSAVRNAASQITAAGGAFGNIIAAALGKGSINR